MSKHYPNNMVISEKPTHVDSSYLDAYGRFIHDDYILPSRTVVSLGPSTPGFKQLQRSGARIPMKNYHKESFLWKHCSGSRMIVRNDYNTGKVDLTTHQLGLMYTKGTPSEWHCRYLYYVEFMYKFVEEHKDLVNSALSNVPHGPDILTFLAEIKELGALHNAVVDAIRKCGRGRFSAPWLLWRYGISPLISDVKDLSEFAAGIATDTLSKTGDYTSGKSSKVTFEKNMSEESGWKFRKKVGDGGVKEMIHLQDVNIKGSLYYQVNGITQSPMMLNINPWLTAWELVPLSFVIDWLVDVGSMLDAITVSSRIDAPEVASNYRFEFNSSAECNMTLPKDPDMSYGHTEDGAYIERIVRSYDCYHNERYGFTGIIQGRNVSRSAQVFPQIPSFRPEINLFRELDALSLYSVFTDKELSSSKGRKSFR